MSVYLLGRRMSIHDFDDRSRQGLTWLISSETDFRGEERHLLSITVLKPLKTLGRTGSAVWVESIPSNIDRGLRWVFLGYSMCVNASAIALIGVLLP